MTQSAYVEKLETAVVGDWRTLRFEWSSRLRIAISSTRIRKLIPLITPAWNHTSANLPGMHALWIHRRSNLDILQP